ncbi:glutamate ABC transporter substrate-binding protein [Saccharomonospora iraqiensis]|uniref:glutamate ABC transporter substrate-binding protein n=1 Tax=Saccharomonospora iraqiensis TaxID=52698 RepID=UPI00022E2B7E|nr:glutamate ABC transporter substrate-binding protein [Saccharomonospora iraqiensis]
MRRPTFLVSALMLASTLVACTAPDAAEDSIVTRASDTGSVTIGIRIDQPGLSERTVDGRIVGFDADVARFVAEELGVAAEDIVWRETVAAERESALSSGSVDMVVAAYSITDSRRQEVSFAGPYYETGQDVLVHSATETISGTAELRGRTLCSPSGSTSSDTVRERFGDAVTLVEYTRVSECVTALLAGRVDAVTTDAAILAGHAAQHPELLRVSGMRLSTERYGVGLPRGDTDARAAVTAALRRMIDSGSWRVSVERNLGPSGIEIPDPPTVGGR